MQRLIARLTSTTGSVWTYGLLMAVVAISISLAIESLSTAILHALQIDPSRFVRAPLEVTPLRILSAVLVAPVVETFFIAWTTGLVKSPEQKLTHRSRGCRRSYGVHCTRHAVCSNSCPPPGISFA